jgi:hypothetical protein
MTIPGFETGTLVNPFLQLFLNFLWYTPVNKVNQKNSGDLTGEFWLIDEIAPVSAQGGVINDSNQVTPLCLRKLAFHQTQGCNTY